MGWASRPLACDRAAATRYHKLGVLKRQAFILSQFWRPGVQNQAVSRALGALGKNPSLPLPVLGAPGVPWLVAASLQSLPLWPHAFLLCVCVPLWSVMRTVIVRSEDPPG